MKIVIFSINPIFPDKVTGGASKHLYHIARHLGEMGHQVEILCAGSLDEESKFYWADQVTVLPVLPFHLPFPQPYAVSGGELALMVSRLFQSLEKADRFYIHDGEWLIPGVYDGIPTTTSFRDNIYPESVLGSFVTKADEIICISQYSADVIISTAGQFYPGISERLHLINNGIDLSVFSPKDPSSLANELGLDRQKYRILLHPHRQEPGKGLSETVQVVSQLVYQYGFSNLKVLVPRGIKEMVSAGESDYHQEMLDLMESQGVVDHFVSMPWLPNERMPELYSLGDLTLCMGRFVETFGNVAYESLACGTPSIVARVGVHRTLLPDELIEKVHYGDVDTAAALAVKILRSGKQIQPGVLDYLKKEFDFEKQVHSYGEIITGCKKKKKFSFTPSGSDGNKKYVLAPWCYFHENKIFNDFKSSFEDARDLSELLKRSDCMYKKDAFVNGITENQWESWINKTWIVPNYKD